MADIISGSQGLLAVINGTLGFINNMKETKDRELALLRLLYMEINENLEVMKTIKWSEEAGVSCTDPAYKEIAKGLSNAAHQAVLTTRILDNVSLSGWEIGGEPIMVNRIELNEMGENETVEKHMQVSQALKTVCVSISTLQRLADMNVSPEVSRSVRYGIRLENVESYLCALNNKLLESEQVKPLETL